jgi:ketosteroid isomerase-like protein
VADPAFEAFKEAVTRGAEAVRRGDVREGWSAVPEHCEFHPPPEFPDPAVRRGPDEIADFILGVRETIPDWGGEPAEFIDAGDGTYVVHLIFTGTSGGTGFPLVQELFQVYELRGGEVVRIREFLHRNQAMRAAGLED